MYSFIFLALFSKTNKRIITNILEFILLLFIKFDFLE